MTWTELCEKAKELEIDHVLDEGFAENLCLEIYSRDYLDSYDTIVTDLSFYKNGDIRFGAMTIANGRTFEQMFAIMEALR